MKGLNEMYVREPKLAGRHKLKAMRMLATGLSQHEVARQMDVTHQAVSKFATRYQAEIQQIKDNLDDEFAGLWIAEKRARLAEYQRVADEMQEDLATVDFDGSVTEARRVVMAALKAAAEETGQLVQRTQVSGQLDTQTKYTIEGVDLKNLT